jgi:hypothetical protein
VQERSELILGLSEVLVERERKGRTVIDDIRGNILTLAVSSDAADWALVAELKTQPRGVRPMELLGALDPNLRLVRATRTHQWIDRDGERTEPLLAGVFTAAVPKASVTS